MKHRTFEIHFDHLLEKGGTRHRTIKLSLPEEELTPEKLKEGDLTLDIKKIDDRQIRGLWAMYETWCDKNPKYVPGDKSDRAHERFVGNLYLDEASMFDRKLTLKETSE